MNSKCSRGRVDDPWSLRRKESLLVPDGNNLDSFTESERGIGSSTDDISMKRLSSGDPNDARIIWKLVEKAIDNRLREIALRSCEYALEPP